MNLPPHNLPILCRVRHASCSKDGTIDREEFHQGVGELGIEVQAPIVDAVFDLLDDDGGGTLHFNEISKALKMAGRAAASAKGPS